MSTALITNDYGRFAQIPLAVAFDPSITPNAVKLYTILWGYSSAGDRQAFPSRETIAKHMGKSTDTVDRALKELVTYRAIAIEHAFDRGRQVANLYRILNLGISRPDLFDPGGANAPAKDEHATGSADTPTEATQSEPDGEPSDDSHRSSETSRTPAPRGAAPVRPRGRNHARDGGRTSAEGIYEQEPEEQESSSSVPASPPGASGSCRLTEEDSSSQPVIDASQGSAINSPASPDGAAGSEPVIAGSLEARLRAGGIDAAFVDVEAAKAEVLGARAGHRIGDKAAYVAAAVIREPWRWPLNATDRPPVADGPVDGAGPAGQRGRAVRKRVAVACPRCGHEWLWWEPRTGAQECPDCEHIEDAGTPPEQTKNGPPGKVA